MSKTKNPQIEKEIYDALPTELKVITEHFDGREKDIVLLSSLGVLSSMLPKYYGIYGGKRVYPNLYVMIIAPPASGKGVMNYAKALVDPIHQEVLNRYKVKLKKWHNDKANGKVKGPMPVQQSKIIPANISSAELYSSLQHIDYSGIMIESEADTLSIMLKQDWGNFSDVLRKVFHHESISIKRKIDNIHIEINEPCMSLVLSGTPDQLGPLVQSRDNGLFSRIMYYNFNTISRWKNAFAQKKDLKVFFEDLGIRWGKPLYNKLINRKKMLEFKFSKKQEDEFNTEMERILDIVMKDYPKGFRSNCIRHGLIFFRIAMILSTFSFDGKTDNEDEFFCSDQNFELALKLTQALLYHALYTYESACNSSLPIDERNFLSKLKVTFKRKEAVNIGRRMGFSVKTIDNKFRQWEYKKLIKKVKTGVYEKI